MSLISMDNIDLYYSTLCSRPELIIERLKEVFDSNDETYAAELHPLGFIHVDLTPNKEAKNISLHYWPKNIKTSIHNHCFDLTSTVIFGSILDTKVELNYNSSEGWLIHEITYDLNKKQRIIKPKGNTKYSYTEKIIREIKISQTYTISKDEYHFSVHSNNTPTLTLMKREHINNEERTSHTLRKKFDKAIESESSLSAKQKEKYYLEIKKAYQNAFEIFNI